MAIPRRELRVHKCLSSGAHISSYGFPQAMRPASQHPHRRVTTASYCTTDNQPKDRYTRKPNPGTPTTGYTAPTPTPSRDDHPTQEHTTVDRAPGGTIAAPQHSARTTLRYPLTHRPTPSWRGPHSMNPITTTTHTDSPHPKTSMQANLTPPGQAAHLRYMHTSYSFAQGGSQGNRGWPDHRHPKAATPQAVPGDTEAQTPPHDLPSISPLVMGTPKPDVLGLRICGTAAHRTSRAPWC